MLQQNPDNFSLIETILWENNELFLLDLHLKRLQKSAKALSFSFNNEAVLFNLKKEVNSFVFDKKYRIRLLLDTNGNVQISSYLLNTITEYPVKIKLSHKKTDKNDIFLYHKTTNRSLYEKDLSKYQKTGFFDVIFTNQNNEITEGAITNILIQKNREYLTPPLTCGLLNGTYREFLLKYKTFPLTEKVLYKQDIVFADRIFLINSVRKFVPAVFVE
ncbi:MAG: aminotransferase class IV [Candidatus Omnitrophota bacterium]